MPPRADSPEGTLRLHRRFASHILENQRDLVVWLPPGIDGRKRRHPVVYFQDGQNLFDPRTAFLGQAWHAGRIAAELIRARELDPPIMVGIYNMGVARMDEYAPTRGIYPSGEGKENRSRGLVRNYARFVAEEVKPFIDARYPTRPEREHTAIAGSSMGGLAALYAALTQSRVFGSAAVMSASVWWDGGAPLKFVTALKKKPPVRLWLDTGTAEPGWENTRRLRDALLARGWRLGGDGTDESHGANGAESARGEEGDLHYLEVEGAGHNEAAWAARTGAMLRWVVGNYGM